MSWWTSASSMNFSVDAHQIMTSRSQPCSALKRRMSSRIVSTSWSFVSTVRVLSPLIRFTYSESKAAGIGSTDFRKSPIGSRSSWRLSTPHLRAASYALSAIGSHAPKTRSSREASGTNSRTGGAWPSVRFPRRMVAIWVIEPMGRPMPRLMCSTPAMKVDDTAPRPTSSTPSLPSAGAMVGPSAETKCLGSSAMPFSRARSSSRSCHCAGIRPVFAQCWTVLWLRDSSLASADWPPKRSITCSAGFWWLFMPCMLPIFSVGSQGPALRGSCSRVDGTNAAPDRWIPAFAGMTAVCGRPPSRV